VAPFFAPIEIGMADKTVAGRYCFGFWFYKGSCNFRECKKRRFGISSATAKIPQFGGQAKIKDPADAKAMAGRQKSKISVENVFNTLLEIAKTSGSGTVDKRKQLFSDLLKELDPISAKHLVRMALGRPGSGSVIRQYWMHWLSHFWETVRTGNYWREHTMRLLILDLSGKLF